MRVELQSPTLTRSSTKTGVILGMRSSKKKPTHLNDLDARMTVVVSFSQRSKTQRFYILV
jgi:hypothetical protein